MDAGPLPRVWLLVGPTGCGKSEAGRFLQEAGYRWIEASHYFREEIPPALRFPERPAAVERFFALRGRDVVAARVLAALHDPPAAETVITGHRLVEEIALFRRHTRPTVLAVLASSDVRYRRILDRGRGDAPLSYEEFLRSSAWELSLGLARIIYEADYVIVNEGPIEALHNALMRRVIAAGNPARSSSAS